MSTKSVKSVKGQKFVNSDDWHVKIAKARGERWRKNVLAGRRDARLNPSLICLCRIKKNVMQSEIAKKLGMSESAFGKIERGKQLVKIDTAKAISLLLGVPMAKLFKSEGKKFVAVVQRPAI